MSHAPVEASQRVPPDHSADEEAHAFALKTMRERKAHASKGAAVLAGPINRHPHAADDVTNAHILDTFGPKGSTALLAASTKGDANLVAELLALGATPTLRERSYWGDGDFPIIAASRFGHAEVVRALLPYMDAASINQAKMITGETALHTACLFDHPEVVKALLESDLVDPNCIGVNGPLNDWPRVGRVHYGVADVPLRTACMNRSVDIVRMLLNHPGTNPNLIVSESIIPGDVDDIVTRHDIEAKKQTALSEVCLESGNGVDSTGSKDRIAIIKLLLAQPGINLKDGTENPLVAACTSTLGYLAYRYYSHSTPHDEFVLHRRQREANKAEVVALLLDAGADLHESCPYEHHYADYQDNYGVNVRCAVKPLHLAVIYGNMSIAQVLVERGADVNELSIMVDTSLQGITPLMAVLGDIQSERSDQSAIAQILLDFGADPILIKVAQAWQLVQSRRHFRQHAMETTGMLDSCF